MQTGAFAMMDALGFREAIRTCNGDQLLERMVRLRTSTLKHLEEWRAVNQAMQIAGGVPDVTFLSDTVVISLPEMVSPAMTVHTVAIVASILMSDALDEDPKFVYRGCVSYGEFAVRDHFVVGKAVTAAAELAEIAQGAFVWLDSVALAARAGWADPGAPYHNLMRWKVPMKGGDVFDTFAVLPFGFFHDKPTREAMIRVIDATFAVERLDVQVKRQRTVEFLEAGNESVSRLQR